MVLSVPMAVNNGTLICVLETQGQNHGQINPHPLLACHYLARDYADNLVCYPLPTGGDPGGMAPVGAVYRHDCGNYR
jgi:hypothetical protein